MDINSEEWRGAVLRRETDIRGAVESIDAGRIQISLVVDDDERLIGTVTDGDVRRGLLRGVRLEDSVERVMNANPITARLGISRDEALSVMRRRGVAQLPILDDGGRLVAVETMGHLLASQAPDTWVVLMAGGRGTRLRPLTEQTPKPLLPVGGKPLIERIVENFVEQGFQRFFFSVNYKAEMFRDHFGDGSSWGARIEFLEEDEELGTAGALSLLPEQPSRPMIVMNSDLLTSVNFIQLLDYHNNISAPATMGVREYSFQVPYGVVMIDGDRMQSISEKPEHHFFVNAGIYVLDPEVVDLIPASCFYDMPRLFDTLIEQDRHPAVFPIREYWLDIGHIEDLERARGDFQEFFA